MAIWAGEQVVSARGFGPGSHTSKEVAAAAIIQVGHPTASDPAYAERRVLEDPVLAQRIYRQAVERSGDGGLSALREAADRLGISRG
jgi:hypothetical protein